MKLPQFVAVLPQFVAVLPQFVALLQKRYKLWEFHPDINFDFGKTKFNLRLFSFFDALFGVSLHFLKFLVRPAAVLHQA